MIANHASHLDAVLLASVLPCRLCDRVFPVAAGDVFFNTPGMSLFAANLLNALPMWRKNCGSHALKDLRKRLVDEPCGLILFPEGARSRDGSLLPFKVGLGMLIAGTSVPVIPCYLDGAFRHSHRTPDGRARGRSGSGSARRSSLILSRMAARAGSRSPRRPTRPCADSVGFAPERGGCRYGLKRLTVGLHTLEACSRRTPRNPPFARGGYSLGKTRFLSPPLRRGGSGG